MSFLKELAHRIRLKTADPQSFHHLCQTISATIQRFNSVAILGSINNQSFVQKFSFPLLCPLDMFCLFALVIIIIISKYKKLYIFFLIFNDRISM